MKLTFCYYRNPILRKKGELITEITDEIKELVALIAKEQKQIDTLYERLSDLYGST